MVKVVVIPGRVNVLTTVIGKSVSVSRTVVTTVEAGSCVVTVVVVPGSDTVVVKVSGGSVSVE